MGWILMQPANDNDSVRATVYLAKTGICVFELFKKWSYIENHSFWVL